MDRSERERSVQGWEKGKKRATLACHSECLHNGIILIVYILQICWCKGSAFCWNNKIFSHKFADFMYFLYFCSRIVHWNPNKTTDNAIKNKTFYLTYYVDFIDIDNKYIFEIDGGYHEEEKQKKKDDKRDKVLKEMGYKVIRYTNNEILCNPNEIKKKLINIYFNH